MTPSDEYRQRHAARQAAIARLQSRENLLANLRLVVFLAALILAFIAYRSPSVSWYALLVPLVVFAALVIGHDKTLRALRRARAAAAHYARAIDRLEGKWSGVGHAGGDLVPPHHPYAHDLDLIGTGSLFQLMNTARTRAGEKALADWLCAPATKTEAEARQTAVAELRPRVDLREELALLGIDLESGVHPAVLIEWAAAPPVFASATFRVAALVALAVACAIIVAGIVVTGAILAPILLALIVQIAVGRRAAHQVGQIIRALDEPAREFAVLEGVLARLESEPLTSSMLRDLQSRLSTGDLRASTCIARLNRLITLHEARNNQMFAPIALLVLWDVHFAFAFEAWRLKHGPRIATWLDAVGALEALGSVAAYAYENPGDVTPVLVESPPRFDAEQVGHPLLPEHTCVRNDVRLGGELHALIVSGSNMSGKSTLLRTVGVNAVLAMLGAPVRARSMTLSPLQIGATLRVQDSIQDGSSRFYAEIRRIRQTVELADGPFPLLFLFDEILHGTNSHDRKIGADAIIKGLLAKPAIGLVSTHDLALCATADELAPRVANVHFEDHIEDGRLTFDYRMRPGVVQKSNALELMRNIGLDV